MPKHRQKQPGENRRLQLCIAAPLVERFQTEVRFLGIGTRIVRVEETLLNSQADLLRQIVNPFILRWLDGQQAEIVDLDEGSAYIPFYLDKQSSGLWGLMLSQGFASYNQLAETAIYHYFLRQEVTANRVRQQFSEIHQAIVDADEQQLIHLLREWRFGRTEAVTRNLRDLGLDTTQGSSIQTIREPDLSTVQSARFAG